MAKVILIVEDEAKILKDLAKGARRRGAINLSLDRLKRDFLQLSKGDRKYYLCIPDRGKAISVALQKIAKEGDIVVICGKGHETYIDYGGEDRYWSETEAVKEALRGGCLSVSTS